MKLVVTGALGHIGSYLIRELPNHFSGMDIVMLDSMMTQRYPSLFNLPTIGRYQFIETDIRSIDLRPVFDGAHAVIHLAAITDAAGSFERATEVESNNLEATRQVAAACVETGTRLIAISSTSVYGTQKTIVAEDCSPDELKPQSPYAVTKLKEEELVRNLAAEKGLRAICCRFGTIFGISRGIRFHTAVNKFCWQAVMGQPLTVWQTAYEQKRPYLDIADASRAFLFILENDLFDGKVYNFVTANATVRTIVELIKRHVPDVQISFVASQIMNQLSFEVSQQRIEQRGFQSTGDLSRGIGETISLLRQANFDEKQTGLMSTPQILSVPS
jgi:UDP-glucose 4-epimerase